VALSTAGTTAQYQSSCFLLIGRSTTIDPLWGGEAGRNHDPDQQYETAHNKNE
jgi:hypothetical protein